MSEKKQKQSRQYWRRRAIEFEKEWTNRCQKTVEKQLAEHYQKSLGAIQEDILKLYGSFAKDNGLDFDEAKKLLNSQEYRRWRMTMQEYLKKISDGDVGLQRELNTLAMRPRINRLEKLYSETLQELDKLGRKVDDDIKNFLSDSYTGTYTKNIFDFVKIGGLQVAISKLDSLNVEKVLASRWSGKNFSQRIWTNTKLLGGVLKETISNGVHRGLSIQQMSQMVEGKMKAGYSNAVRLVRTEMNFANNQAHFDSMSDAGIEKYEFMAVLDGRTSQKCRERDSEVFLLSEKVVGENYPPLHARCRSTVAPFIEGVNRKGTRIAKDKSGKNIKIPENMKYADYEKVYIKKEATFEDWQKNNLNDATTNGKMSKETGVVPSATVGSLSKLSPQEVCGGVKCKIEYVQETLRNGTITCNAKVYVTPDGVRFIFPENLDPKKQTMTPNQAIETWQRVPLKIRSKAQRKICFLDIENPDDAYWRQKYKNFPGSYATGGDEIIFYKYTSAHSNQYVEKAYCHEAGHYIDQTVGGSARFSQSSAWLDAMSDDKITSGLESVTEYGKNSPIEDFAESVYLYVRSEKVFSAKFPKRAKLLKQIL